jgi:hypothetical protein
MWTNTCFPPPSRSDEAEALIDIEPFHGEWNMPLAPGTSQHLQTAANLSKDDFRRAQLELRNMGLYNGSFDGVVGPETKRALEQFQKNNGLDRTARLDGQTMVALFGNIGISQGSSMPPRLIKAPGL